MSRFGPGRPLVFSHIPKTAGTSLRTSLISALGSRTVVLGFDLSLVAAHDDITALRRSNPGAVHLSPQDLDAEADLVAGHIAPATTAARFPDAEHVTMLRQPALRLLSQWMHSRSLSDFDIRRFPGGVAQAFHAGRAPLHSYLDNADLAPTIDNTITRFLAWPHDALPQNAFIDPADDDALLSAAASRLSWFGFVGVVEAPDSVPELGRWLGVELNSVRANDRRSTPPKVPTDIGAELDAATLDLIERRTRLDRRLWAEAVARQLPQHDPAELADTEWERALERYRSAIASPAPRQPVARRLAETAYGAWQRIRRQ